MKNIWYLAVLLLLFSSCGSDTSSDNSKESVVVQPEKTNPNPQPVANFSEDVTTETGRLNHWKFAVDLYETAKAFTYRIQVQYGEAIVTDSFQFPNLGFEPKPVLKKGKDEYSCIVGFMDNKNAFREFKSVTVTDDNIRIHTLKYYSASSTGAVQ